MEHDTNYLENVCTRNCYINYSGASPPRKFISITFLNITKCQTRDVITVTAIHLSGLSKIKILFVYAEKSRQRSPTITYPQPKIRKKNMREIRPYDLHNIELHINVYCVDTRDYGEIEEHIIRQNWTK